MTSTFAKSPLKLFVASGENPEEVARGLEGLSTQFANSTATHSAQGPMAAALLATTPEELTREIGLIRNGMAKAIETGNEYKTPAGSSFTAQPLGSTGVAFVYPGIGSPYLGAGAELFDLVPSFHERFAEISEGQGARYMHSDLLYGGGREEDLYGDILTLGEVAMSLSVLYTWMMRDVFGIRPRSALGYSFGEPMMLAALGAWTKPVQLSAHLDRSPTFRTRLHGPMEAIREHWKLDAAIPVNWKSFILKTTPAAAYPVLRDEPHVYLLVVNTPSEIIVAGAEDGCRRVIEKLHCHALKMPMNLTIHCEAVQTEIEEFREIHSLDTASSSEVAFFSSAGYQPMALNQEALAGSVANAYSKMVDFSRLVRNVYTHGARIFIEVGARRNCSSWIEHILKDRPHAAIPCDAKGRTNDISLLRAVARLVAHRVPMDLHPLSP